MATILGVLKAILEALPIISKLVRAFQKTPQEKTEKNIEDQRQEIDEFKKTGRPPR